MEKRIYVAPKTNVVVLQMSSQIMALSGEYVKNGDASGELENLGSRSRLWGDDE
ncbi:MAG: hypothetical protein IJP70_02925 [Bacteroidales bacterium]|nr:hypothetical protein [Bacteroidales bacterium]